MTAAKGRLLVLSHVLPFPGSAGQEQRVSYTLQAARERFHVTFATTAAGPDLERTRERLAALCDVPVVLASRYRRSTAARAWHRCAGAAYAMGTGLKLSNYVIGQIEFPPARVAGLLDGGDFDCVLFEYWHAAASVSAVRARQIPCVLDMHDILWQSRRQRLAERRAMPAWCKRWTVDHYRAREEAAWQEFDGIIAINREEQHYVERRVPERIKTFYAPMGTDLARWPYSWSPSRPVRVAYYGALGNAHNQRDARRCVEGIMPALWQRFPDAELWLVGSNPPAALRALAADPRIHVTGYVEHVQPLLATMTAVLCPWVGTYGFRSRLVEVMALGVPVVATPDAVSGMELEDGSGLLLGRDDAELTRRALHLLEHEAFAREQSVLAREQTVRLFSIDTTYGRLMRELEAWLHVRGRGQRETGRLLA